MTDKQALETILDWPADYEEITSPQVGCFIRAHLSGDSKFAETYVSLLRKSNDDSLFRTSLSDAEKEFIREFEKKHGI